MSILFLILKTIGILILIPIVLLLILLIFPICYQIEGDFDGKSPKAQVKVSWAVIFLRAKAFYEEELNFGIRIFGIPIYDSRKEHWSVFGEHKEKDKKKHKKRSDSKKKQKIKNNKKRVEKKKVHILLKMKMYLISHGMKKKKEQRHQQQEKCTKDQKIRYQNLR